MVSLGTAAVRGTLKVDNGVKEQPADGNSQELLGGTPPPMSQERLESSCNHRIAFQQIVPTQPCPSFSAGMNGRSVDARKQDCTLYADISCVISGKF